MSWIFYSIVAAVILSVVNTNDKIVLSRYKVSSGIFMVFFAVASFLFAAGIFIFQNFIFLPLKEAVLAMFAGATVVVGNFFYFEAAKRQEISKVVGLWHLAPLHTLLLSYLILGEILTPDKYLGVFMVVFGAVLLSVKKGGKFFLGVPFFLMVCGTFFTSLGQVTTKYVTETHDYWTVFAHVRLGSAVALIPFFFLVGKEMKTIYARWKMKPFYFITFSESFTTIAFLFVTIAIATGPVTLATAMVSVQPLILLLLVTGISYFKPDLLKEKIDRTSIIHKFVSIVLIVSGVVLIS